MTRILDTTGSSVLNTEGFSLHFSSSNFKLNPIVILNNLR